MTVREREEMLTMTDFTRANTMEMKASGEELLRLMQEGEVNIDHELQEDIEGIPTYIP